MTDYVDGKPRIIRFGNINFKDENLLLGLIREVNPKVEEAIQKSNGEGRVIVGKPKRNIAPNTAMKYNTIIEVWGDGCTFRGADEDKILFSYGRWDIGRMAFKETGTIGVPDVPVNVKSNDVNGITSYFYNAVDKVEFVTDVDGYPGVKQWKVTVNEDNIGAIFTSWVVTKKDVEVVDVNGNKTTKTITTTDRVYSNDFMVYAKQYNPTATFEDSDFVE